MKAKYYATPSVLEAKPKAGMSYSWHCVLRAIEFVKNGMIWRVGDGLGLNIWTDPWIPRDFSRRLITPRGLLTEVAELIDHSTDCWDVAPVRDTFWEEDVS